MNLQLISILIVFCRRLFMFALCETGPQ